MEKKKVPVVPWFTFPSDEPHLIGSRCKLCGDYFFPKVEMCRNPRCRSKDVEEVLLSRTARIWSYVIQEAAPPPPFPARDPFVPYALAEMKLPEGIKIMGMVASGVPFDSLQIGMEMELVTERFYEDKDGNEVVTWKFKPLASKKRSKK